MSRSRVVILDYKLGNLFSVKHACDYVGITSEISSDYNSLKNAAAIILPGVGAFGEAMANLHNLNLEQPLKEFVATGKPIFGICLGLQLLFTKSEEFGEQNGLNLIKGVINKFPYSINGKKVKVPQIAWNQIHQPKGKNWDDTPLIGISDKEYFYFVHSFYVVPKNHDEVLTTTNYEGLEYCSGIIKNNIFAVQFHPEKSGEKGIAIYKNWAKLYGII